MKIAVGSTNPVKLQCVKEVVLDFYPNAEVHAIATNSGVSSQPLSEKETRQGALNRALSALESSPDTTIGFGLEGGCFEGEDGIWAFAWITAANKAGKIGHGQTGRFLLPPGVAKLIREGKELGEADDIFFDRTNSKREEGAVGLLTDKRITRAQFYKPAVMFALLPFLKPEFYGK